jgi:hypothetical protein
MSATVIKFDLNVKRTGRNGVRGFAETQRANCNSILKNYAWKSHALISSLPLLISHPFNNNIAPRALGLRLRGRNGQEAFAAARRQLCVQAGPLEREGKHFINTFSVGDETEGKLFICCCCRLVNDSTSKAKRILGV